MLVDGHEMISWGYANPTPWHSHREMTEERARASVFERLAGELSDSERAIFNVHAPPYDTRLDEAPVLDENLQVQHRPARSR